MISDLRFAIWKNIKLIAFATVITGLLSACSASTAATETETLVGATETVAASEAPAATATAGFEPTLEPVAAVVSVANASCRVGPGGAYLVRQVLHDGDAVEIRGQMELNPNWILVSVANSGARCWINTNLVTAPAEAAITQISDPHVVLPHTTYYSPLQGVTARRDGDLVRVRWDPMVLREDDQIEETHYVLAAWVCQDGSFVFRSAGSNEYSVFIRDERGCDQLSHGLVMAAEKHGYTQPVQVNWP